MSFARIIRCVCLLAFAAIAVTSHAQGTTIDGLSRSPHVVISTSAGDIVVELDAENAPNTVDNFLAYVDDNFYADTLFHRVIEGFMIQGGGFTPAFRRKTTRSPVSNEAYNRLKNRKYTIAMARTTAPHSATSQFFINTDDNNNLDHTDTSPRGWGYTVFGRVVDGRQVVDTISQVKTGSGGHFKRDVPVDDIVITSITRVPSGIEQESSTHNRADDQGTAKPANKAVQNIKPESAIEALKVDPVPGLAPSTETVKQN